ncbi:MAG: hypothetical protein Q7O66_01495 [Dehalococcoidia bacterium]|nr:hypothetical protein [Dehalococcoidia bacterium]
MSDRLDREIEEILRKSGSNSPRRLPVGKFQRLLRRWKPGTNNPLSWLRATPTSVMVVSLVLFGLSVFLRMAFRQLALLTALLAICLFVTAIVMSARQGGGTRYERRWRGQIVELPGDSPLSNLHFWWLRQQRKIRRWLDTR